MQTFITFGFSTQWKCLSSAFTCGSYLWSEIHMHPRPNQWLPMELYSNWQTTLLINKCNSVCRRCGANWKSCRDFLRKRKKIYELENELDVLQRSLKDPFKIIDPVDLKDELEQWQTNGHILLALLKYRCNKMHFNVKSKSKWQTDN